MAVELRFILNKARHRVALTELDEESEGTEVAVVSDLQIGMRRANTGMVEPAIETIVADEPDVVLLGGDFVYSMDPSISTPVDNVLHLLAPLIEAQTSPPTPC